MKRPHRRIHLVAWLIIAPVAAAAGFLFWTQRPATPYTDDLPPAIEAIQAADAASQGER